MQVNEIPNHKTIKALREFVLWTPIILGCVVLTIWIPSIDSADNNANHSVEILQLVGFAGFLVFVCSAVGTWILALEGGMCADCKHPYWKHYDKKGNPVHECTEKKCKCGMFVPKPKKA